MTAEQLFVYLLRFYIPAFWSVLFRAAAFGYISKRRLALGLLVFTAYTMGVPAVLITAIGYGEFTHISSLVMVLGGMAVLIFSTDSVGKTVFIQLTQSGISTAMSVILSMVRTVFDLSYTTLLILFAIFSPILFFVGLKFWAKPLRYLIDNLPDKLGSLFVLPVFSMLIAWLIPIYPPQNFANHPIFCTVIMLGAELALFAYVYTLYRSIRRIHFLSREESQNKLLQAEISSYQEYLESARQSRHDLRHHDALLLSCLEGGDTAGAIAYLRSHEQALEESALIRYCDEPTISAVLRIYDRRASELGVRFSATAQAPKGLRFNPAELGGLLGNALENALNAAQKVTDGYISFNAAMEDDNLLIEIRNSVQGETGFQNGVPVSQKTGGGTGTRSMLRVVQRNGGILNFSQAGNEFFTRIILPL